jgi:hypothetical protein
MQLANRNASVVKCRFRNCELIACTAPSKLKGAEYRISTLAKNIEDDSDTQVKRQHAADRRCGHFARHGRS